MILLYDKTFEDLSEKAEASLTSLGFSTSPGSITKLLLNIINENLAEFYETLKINHLQSFISTSTGEFLEAIAVIVNCYRLVDETDEDFRFRITKQILTTATANETAIKLAALSVIGVQDVVLKNYSYGAGSFSLLIITDNAIADEILLLKVKTIISEVVGYGIKYEIINPIINTIKIQIKLLLKEYLSDGTKEDINNTVNNALKVYFTTRNIKESLITNEITKQIMESSDDITDYVCSDFRINDKLTTFTNQDCRWNERYMLSSDPNAILIS